MASSSSECSDHNDLVDQFCAVTSTDRATAENLLEICSWNLEMAINMHWDTGWSGNGIDKEPSSYSTDPTFVEEDDIRAPIPPSRAVLVDDVAPHIDFRLRRRRVRSVFDGLRDFQAEAKWQEDFQSLDSSKPSDSNTLKKRKTLEDLFRPPLDLIYRGSFEAARESGKTSNKWLMVNVQDSQEFACQVLNRDVWSNQAVKNIISTHFIFWQVYCDSDEGQRYMQFYKPVTFPYIAIIDPRTGENVAVWNEMDCATFCRVISMFLNEHSVLDDSFPLSGIGDINIVNTSEEEQIKAAIAASLKDIHANKYDDDDDNSDLETFASDTESEHSVNCKPEVTYKNDDNRTKSNKEEDWKQYLGANDGDETTLILRLPDGKRESVTWPCSTRIKALWLFSESLGFSSEKYELVTNYPRKNLSQAASTKSLKDLGLYPREMIFVQLKDSS